MTAALGAPVAVADQATGEGAARHHVAGDGVVDTAIEAAAAETTKAGTPDGATHGPKAGHLPPVQDDIELVSKLKLTDVEGGIADVGVLGNFAYLAAWSPECLESDDPDSRGGGVHVVDFSDPKAPKKVAFAPAPPNTYVGEGVHVFRMETASFKGDVLLMNHEGCDTDLPYQGGFSAYDVTNPSNPKPLALGVGESSTDDDTEVLDASVSHSAHSIQGWSTGTNAYAVVVDNQDLEDIDIFDITDPTQPKLISERGFENFPQIQSPLANGDSVFHHDSQIKQINGRWLLQVSYWDAGYVTLDVTDPANPVYVADSDFTAPEPISGQAIPEGNAHQSYWSHDNRFILGADEDFSPFRTAFEITEGPNAGPYGAGEFGWTVPLDQKFPNGLSGPTIYGGTGCPAEREGVPPASQLPANEGEAKIIVFTRGGCFFSEKVESGELAGYDAVIVGQSHAGTRNGLLVDGFLCGSKGHEYDPKVSGICIGHRAQHNLFDDEPNYTGPNNTDIPIGKVGRRINASTEFDGWGYVHLYNANTLAEIDTYAVDEAFDARFASGFGDLSVHETKTDPTENLAYIAYYEAGIRVAQFGDGGIEETGAFIDEGKALNGAPASGPGSDFWGVFPVTGSDQERYILGSDRSYGLYVLKYTGPGAAERPRCADATVQTEAGKPVRIALSCSDANGNPLTRSITDAPDNGTLGAIEGDAVTYTPKAGFSGSDVFRFRANDGAANSEVATITVVVKPAPVTPATGRCANPLVGTAANDLLNGTPLGDAIRGGAGNDVMTGLQGDDCLYGETGNDRLGGGEGNDVLHGGDGDDRVFADSGDDEIRGDAGDDHLRGSSGDDRIYGSVGGDYLSGGSNNDYLSGGSGPDSLRGDAGNDRIFGGAGNDSIDTGKGRNGVSAGAGRDKITAVNGSKDNIKCGPGRDVVRADRVDQVDRSCEVVKRTKTTRRR